MLITHEILVVDIFADGTVKDQRDGETGGLDLS